MHTFDLTRGNNICKRKQYIKIIAKLGHLYYPVNNMFQFTCGLLYKSLLFLYIVSLYRPKQNTIRIVTDIIKRNS